MTEPAGLILVATPIGNLGDLSQRAIDTLTQVESIACEDTRRTGRLLKHFGIPHTPFIVCNEHTEAEAASEIIRRLDEGTAVALVSDAGMPAISDPGERVVRMVVDAGHPVTAVPGANAVLTALAVSGLPTDRFVFEGFLPRKGSERTARIGALASETRTAVVYESPKRVAKTLTELRDSCGGERPVAVVRELTKLYETAWRGSLDDAVAHHDETEPRGEYVLVLGGAVPVEASDEVLRDRLAELMGAGETRRGAIDHVVAELGVNKRRVYDLALDL